MLAGRHSGIVCDSLSGPQCCCRTQLRRKKKAMTTTSASRIAYEISVLQKKKFYKTKMEKQEKANVPNLSQKEKKKTKKIWSKE